MSLREELIQVAAVAVATITDIDHGSTAMIESHSTSSLILLEVLNERRRQEAKWGERHQHPLRWLAILTEEVGEVAEAIIEGHVDWDGNRYGEDALGGTDE